MSNQRTFTIVKVTGMPDHIRMKKSELKEDEKALAACMFAFLFCKPSSGVLPEDEMVNLTFGDNSAASSKARSELVKKLEALGWRNLSKEKVPA